MYSVWKCFLTDEHLALSSKFLFPLFIMLFTYCFMLYCTAGAPYGHMVEFKRNGTMSFKQLNNLVLVQKY